MFEILFNGSYMSIIPQHVSRHVRDTCMKFLGIKKCKFYMLVTSEDAMGGVEKGGGWKTSRMTPFPKRGFGPPLLRYVFHPPQVSLLCFSCTKIHDRADQKLFWRGPKIFGRARSLVRFPPPPYVLQPPHITAQVTCRNVSELVMYLIRPQW